MWLLLYIALHGNVEGTATILRACQTKQECQAWRNHVGFEMAAAYPYERSFVIECRKVKT